MRRLKFLYGIFILGILSSCMDDDQWYEINRIDLDVDSLADNYVNRQRGLFIVNEGNFMYDNASLSFYMIDSMKVLNDIFFRTNALPLGDVAHSMLIRDSLAYIVLNNSGRIYVINNETFKLEGSITGLVSPRYIHILSDEKAYVTDLYGRSVRIVDPDKLEVTGFIDVSNGNNQYYQHSTEMMVRMGQYLYINCWSYDNQVLVIDTERDMLVDSIEVLQQPNSMVLDKNQDLWVLCDGGYPGSLYGQSDPGLVVIDTETRKVKDIYYFDSLDSPVELCINKGRDTLFFINEHIYRQCIDNLFAPELFVKGSSSGGYNGGFYSLSVDPVSSEVYAADAVDNIQRGVVYRFRPDGIPVDTFTVGILPGNFCFK